MNIQAPIKHTAAEESLMQAFEANRDAFSADADVLKTRETAIAQLRDNGLPTRRVESWHYTDLRAALSHIDDAEKSIIGAPILKNAHILSADTDMANVQMQKWSSDGAGFVNVQTDDAIGQINTALASDGTIVAIDADAEIDTPLALENKAAHSRNMVRLGANASALFVQSIAGDDGFATDVTSIDLAEGAKATFVQLCEKGDDATQLGQLRVSLAQDAELNIVVLNAGGKLIRREIVVLVEGENSNLDIKGVNLVGGKSHIDVTTVLAHSVPNTNSEQLFRNIVTAQGKGVFQGQIRVHQIAQKTDAQMACNTLLLSDDAGFSAKPELEIFADDVICAHGATVTELDEDHLFYLMARGITKRTGQSLLVEAFVDEVVEQLEDEALIEALEARIGAWLEANG